MTTDQLITAQGTKLQICVTNESLIPTGGILDLERGHMSGKYVLMTKERLEKIGSVTDSTQYFINHFSHNGQATHAELEAHFNPFGIQVCYDGLKIDF